LADILQTSGALPSYGNRSSWGDDGAVTDLDFLRDPFGHGWHLDRPAFNRALLDAVESAGITVWRQNRVTSIERNEGTWQIATASPDGDGILYADLLVDASGRRSLVARFEHIRRRTLDSQVAAVAFLHPGDHAIPLHDATTIIEAVLVGWWYAALLPGQRLAVSWFTDPDLLAEHAAWRPDGWWNLLQSSNLVGPLIVEHGYEKPHHIDMYPAGSSLLTQPTGDGWIAAGDASASYDPLSSHGIGSALANGRSAARAIAATLTGDPTAFSTYRDHLLANYTNYLCTRHAYYADEHRWPTSPYWRRRQGNMHSLPGHRDF
jgi:flavin-dependent dehydrogenase